MKTIFLLDIFFKNTFHRLISKCPCKSGIYSNPEVPHLNTTALDVEFTKRVKSDSIAVPKFRRNRTDSRNCKKTKNGSQCWADVTDTDSACNCTSQKNSAFGYRQLDTEVGTVFRRFSEKKKTQQRMEQFKYSLSFKLMHINV